MASSLDISITKISPEDLKNIYLVGLANWLVDPTTGEQFPDFWYQHLIDNAIQTFEDFTSVHVLPQEIELEKHDYHLNDYSNFAFLELFQAPILEVTVIQVQYPTNVQGTFFPPEWAKIQGTDKLQLVPTSGTLANIILGRGGAYLPLIYEGGLGYLPQLWWISYKVGFKRNLIPRTIYDAIMKMAGIEVLTMASDLIYGPGVTSISTGFDGISMSKGVSNPLFQSRIENWKRELYGSLPTTSATSGSLEKIKNRYHGIFMRVA